MRRLAVFGICLCGGFIGGLLAGSAMWYFSDAALPASHSDRASNVMSTHEFRLVDGQGKVRALLTFSAQGEPYVEILDEHDTPPVWLGLAQEPGPAIHNGDGKYLDASSGEPSSAVKDRQP